MGGEGRGEERERSKDRWGKGVGGGDGWGVEKFLAALKYVLRAPPSPPKSEFYGSLPLFCHRLLLQWRWCS